jgi:hypothetical protein
MSRDAREKLDKRSILKFDSPGDLKYDYCCIFVKILNRKGEGLSRLK